MITKEEALEQLRQGNKRFVSGNRRPPLQKAERAEFRKGQHPFATILGCSDSRVPVELVFDQGIGDLFVVRVAGNQAAPTLMGSIEFAALNFGTPLVVVLGHSQCGAVKTTVAELRQPTPDLSPNLVSLVDQVRPSVEEILATHPDSSEDELIERMVRANVRGAAQSLRNESAVLKDRIEKGQLLVAGAEYSLETGIVTFFDGIPDSP